MKIKLGLGECSMDKIALFCQGELYDFSGELGCSFEYVCTDSREADEKTMFVATRGERVDGHDYILQALNAGCRCILCEYVPTNISGKACAYVVVENSVDAFAMCAKGYRKNSPLRSVAITGSVGKTTTKEMTAAILKVSFKTYCTAGNFNSVIGMPMSLMEAESDCVRAVFEMGMSDFGEIRSMSNSACPSVAMVTNIGSSHLEYLGTRENIAKAKLEIREGLTHDGVLLLNGDEPLLAKARAEKKTQSTKFVGIENTEKCHIYAENIVLGDTDTSFDMIYEGRRLEGIRIGLVGKHFVYNALFAAAASIILGATDEDVRLGLADYAPASMRMQISKKKGITVIADCYNAAPESVKGAVDSLSAMTANRRVAVLGDMKELGKDSDEMHRDVGKYLAEHNISAVFTLGESGALIAEGAVSSGIAVAFAERDPDGIKSLSEEIAAYMKEGDALLFKGSRAMKMERIIEVLFD